jgi:hypothetical protein
VRGGGRLGGAGSRLGVKHGLLAAAQPGLSPLGVLAACALLFVAASAPLPPWHPPFLPSPQGAEYDAFVKVAQKNEDATFFETTDAAVAKAAGLSAPGVVVVTNFPGALGAGWGGAAGGAERAAGVGADAAAPRWVH